MQLNELPSLRGKRALFYDTETTGLPRDGYTIECQPRVVQLAWQLVVLSDGCVATRVIAESQCILKLDRGQDIPKSASDVHGIGIGQTMTWGLSPPIALDMFLAGVDRADVVVAHNEQFDRRLLQIMFQVWSRKMQASTADFNLKDILCTMELSRDLVQLPATPRMRAVGRHGYKTPKLSESFKHFTGRDLVGAHDAMVDVRATVTVFEALMDAAEREARNEG